MKPAQIPCMDCRNRMTWAQQRVQYGRLKKRGVSEAHIKAALPRCQKCITIWVRNHPQLTGEVS